jgi:hypothetical protein
MSARAPRQTSTDPQVDHAMIVDRGYDIQYAAGLLELLADSEGAITDVPLPLQRLFLQARYLARQIGLNVQTILSEYDDPPRLKGGAK